MVVRYAPSPTGTPHIGNIRTALFNYLFAKNQNGQFILRIEDTDRKRLVPTSIGQIKESLKFLGLNWDGDEIYQSKRLDLYRKYLEILKEAKLTYYKEGAWYFKVENDRRIGWDDGLHGPIEFSSNVIEDFVIVKSDGFPTYHFASVVDDREMQVSHVIRGDEWISSTPKHLLLYQVFDWPPPKFVHLPPILGPDKKKLSKRQGARSVLEYVEDGYLPEALVNFLALLGWAPSPSVALGEGEKREKELFSLNELISEFSLDRLNKNSPIFNIEKLNWFNREWLKMIEDDDLAKRLKQYFPQYDTKKIRSLTPLVKERMKTLLEFPKMTDFFFNRPKILNIPNIPVSIAQITKITSVFEKSKNWNGATIRKLIEDTAKNEKIDRINLIAGIRNIISGSTVTPPLYESLEILGKAETVKRLREYVKKNK